MNRPLPKKDIITLLFYTNEKSPYGIELGTSLFDLLNLNKFLGFNKQNSFHNGVELIQNLENAKHSYLYYLFCFLFFTDLD